MGAAFVYLDQSGKTRAVRQTTWKDPFVAGHWGRYGSWAELNITNQLLEPIIEDVAHYAGDGYWGKWRIKWS